jgi:hypothetical protein
MGHGSRFFGKLELLTRVGELSSDAVLLLSELLQHLQPLVQSNNLILELLLSVLRVGHLVFKPGLELSSSLSKIGCALHPSGVCDDSARQREKEREIAGRWDADAWTHAQRACARVRAQWGVMRGEGMMTDVGCARIRLL